MVGEYKSTFEYPAMVQSGLLRWQPDGFKLQPFVALEHSGGKIDTHLLAPLPENSEEHYFRISRIRNEIDVEIDGDSIFRGPWDEFFRDVKHFYLRIASEVLVGGDAVSGTVRDIELTTPKGKMKPLAATIADEDRGVAFVCQDHRFVAIGAFDSKELTEPRWFRPPPCEGK
jgi:hypothetical protein